MRFPFLIALAICLVACSDSDTGDAACTPTGTDAGDDGKVHPPANGETMTEAEACEQLVKAHEERGKTMMPQCFGTVPACPGLVRGLTAKTDATYDRGSVQGCADYIDSQTGCMALNASITQCVPATHPLPAPAAACP